MRRRDLLQWPLAAQLAAQAAGAAQPEARPAQSRLRQPPRPNILWICTDQQRFDTIAGLNNKHIHTPNLQRFLGESTTFTHAFVQNPVCSPSRASFLTGRYPHTTGLRANGQRIQATERLLPRMLAEHGYECGLAGKLHLSPCAGGRIEDRIDDGYHRFNWSHDLTDTWPGRNMWREWLRAEGVRWPDAPLGTPAWGVPIDPKYSQTSWCADKAAQFIRDQRGFQPWLMSVNFYQPHYPFWPTQDYLRRYNAEQMPAPAFHKGELDNKPEYQRIDHEVPAGSNRLSFLKTGDLTHRKITAAYYAMIEEIDHHFGRLLQVLEDTGQSSNTIVVFMSDHGEMLGDHGIYWKGPYFYDCGLRVPLIVRWPGQFRAGQQVDALVEMVDLAPTLLEAAGIAPHPGMQGKSLLRVLRGETRQHRDSVYMENYDPVGAGGRPVLATALRTRRHKLAVYHSLNAGELYDLEKDPGEFQNLWADARYRDVRGELTAALMERMIETLDPLPRKNAPW